MSSVNNVAEAHMGAKWPFVNGFRDLCAKRQGFADIFAGSWAQLRCMIIEKDELI